MGRPSLPLESVDDDDLGLLGALLGLDGEAGLTEGAVALAGALVGGRGQLGLVTHVDLGDQVVEVAGQLGAASVDLLQQRVLVEDRLRRELGELGAAQVVATALEDREAEVDAELLGEDLLEERQVLTRVLVLEGLGGGGDGNRLTALERVEDRRDEAREALAGAGARLGEQVAVRGEVVLDRVGQALLGGTGLVAGQRLGESGLCVVPGHGVLLRCGASVSRLIVPDGRPL